MKYDEIEVGMRVQNGHNGKSGVIVSYDDYQFEVDDFSRSYPPPERTAVRWDDRKNYELVHCLDLVLFGTYSNKDRMPTGEGRSKACIRQGSVHLGDNCYRTPARISGLNEWER